MKRLIEVFGNYTSDGRGCICLALAGADASVEAARRTQGFEFRAFDSKLEFVRAVIRTALRFRPDITVVGHLGLSPVAMLVRLLGVTRRYAIVLHGIEAWRRAEWKDRIAARGADAVVATTRYTALEFSRLNGVSSRKLRVLPLALGEKAMPDAPDRADRGITRVLTVGRLASSERYKGVDTLLLAMGRLTEAGYKVELDIVGVGDDLERFQRMAKEMGISGLVRFHGAVSDSGLQDLYSACDVFAMPSKGEGFGIVFLEAMRYGKPCIGGNHGGTPEVIDDGVTGFLVEHGDADGLADRIRSLIESPGLCAQMGCEGRQKVQRHYLFESFDRNWRGLLDEMLQPEEAASGTAVIAERS
jgi:glycosyltransferase involved in cell wall biosynthesis